MVVNYVKLKRAAHLLFVIVLFEVFLLSQEGYLNLEGRNQGYVVCICALVYWIIILVIYLFERRAKKRFKASIK